MKEWIGKKAQLTVELASKKQLFFNATVTKATEEHLTFVDKYGEEYTFRISNIIQIKEKNENLK